MRKRVYVAGPISKGDLLHNVRQADAAFLALFKAGFAPFNPMLSVFCNNAYHCAWTVPPIVLAVAGSPDYPSPLTHEEWLSVDLPWVSVADAVLRLSGESVGADQETAHASSLGIPVYSSVEALCDDQRS